MRISNCYTDTEVASVSLEHMTNRKDRVIWQMFIPPMEAYDAPAASGFDITFGGEAGSLVLRSSRKVKVY